MANETSKAYDKRLANGDFVNFLHGEGIDVGAGADCLQTPAKGDRIFNWDLKDGDGQKLDSIDDETFDFQFSSHTLEHVVDVDDALKNWIRVVKPGGFIYCVIPDWHYYEKEKWPSQYNGDHKSTFSLDKTRKEVGRNNHFHIEDLEAILKKHGATLLESRLEIEGFDENSFEADQTRTGAMSQLCFIAQKNK